VCVYVCDTESETAGLYVWHFQKVKEREKNRVRERERGRERERERERKRDREREWGNLTIVCFRIFVNPIAASHD
jgi:hypothetical protein